MSGPASTVTDLAGNRLSTSAANRWTNLPGDANEDERFDRLDVDQVVQLGRYNTGQAASWRSGDWSGNGVFDQFDIIRALQTGQYLDSSLGALQAVGPLPENRVVLARIEEDGQTVDPPAADEDLSRLDSLFGQLGNGP